MIYVEEREGENMRDGSATDAAQAKKMMELGPTTMKMDIHGGVSTHDSEGNVLDASLIYKDGELIVTKEYINFLMKKTNIKELMAGYYKDKGKINAQIITKEDHYSYIVTGENGVPLFSATFRPGRTGWWPSRPLLEIDCVITRENPPSQNQGFSSTQYNKIVSVMNLMEKSIKEYIKAVEILKKAKVKVKVEA